MTKVKNSKRPQIQFIPMNCLHWGKWKSLMLQQISVYVNTYNHHCTL
jgi:hypothetical protein